MSTNKEETAMSQETVEVAPREGVDRCECGSKYWDGVTCHSCGEKFRSKPAPEPLSQVFEQRGYFIDREAGTVTAGWFRLSMHDQRMIVRRHIRGRNAWLWNDVRNGFFVADSKAKPGTMTTFGWAQ